MSSKRAGAQSASGVLLLRRGEKRGFEVFLRRSSSTGGSREIYRVPLGGLLQIDCSPRMIARCAGLAGNQARQILGAHLSPARALGFWVAAVRALFEETGILLAREESDARLDWHERRAGVMARKREALLAGMLDFPSLLEAEALRCDLKSLAHFSHWLAEDQFSELRDTQFFVTALPGGQVRFAAGSECADSLWLAPDDALARFKRGALVTIFPIFASLRTLADFETIDAVLKEFFPERFTKGV